MIKRMIAVNVLLISSLLGKVIDIESVQQYKELAQAGTLVTMFTASWCGLCKQIKPHYKALSEEYDDVTFCMIDVDNEALKEIERKSLGFVVTHKEKEYGQKAGANSKRALKEFIDESHAKVLGKEYTPPAMTFLTAEQYHKLGYENGLKAVEVAQQKDVTAALLGSSYQRQEEIVVLGEACKKPETAKEAFAFYKEYNRGFKEALASYKPRQ